MFKRIRSYVAVLLSVLLLLSACGGTDTSKEVSENLEDAAQTTQADEDDIIVPHQGLNQEPVPVKMERDGKDVFIEMTTQITDIEIEPGYEYKAWTFNGEAPGPLLVVEKGDTLHISLDDLDRSEERRVGRESRYRRG